MSADLLPRLSQDNHSRDDAQQRLSRFWSLYRQRSATTHDLAGASYVAYLAALLVGVVVAPAIHTVFEFIRTPSALATLGEPSARQWVGTIAGTLLAALTTIGTVRGPVIRSPFLIVTLANNDLPRRFTLARLFRISGATLTVTLIAVAAVVGLSFVTASSPALSAGPFVVATAAYGYLTTVFWLLAQRAEVRGWALGPLLGVVVIVGAAVPSLGRVLPWGWFSATWPTPDDAGSTPHLIALMVLALIAGSCVPRLLDALEGPALLGQARRWQSASHATAAGDLAGAMARFRADPTVGRCWQAVGGPSWALATARSDLIGAARTPVRFAAGLLTLTISGWLVAAAASATTGTRWALAAAAGVLVYSALGVLSDGVRHSISAAVAPPLYGRSDRAQFCVRALVPLVGGAALGLGGVLVHVAQGGSAALPAAGATVVLTAAVTAVRFFDSAKGSLPPGLFLPVSTPVGDLSGVSVLAWQLDAILYTAVLAALVVGTFTVLQPVAGALFITGSIAVLVWAFLRRVEAL